MGLVVQTLVRTIREASVAIRELEAVLAEQLGAHPDAEILQSTPGLGVVSGGRILGEFGDDPARFADAGGRRCYAGTAPVTRASGKSRLVLLRRARNQRLSDACRWGHTPRCNSPSVPAPTTTTEGPPATATRPRSGGWPTS